MTAKDSIEVVYDGDCPFCSRFVRLVRLRENFTVKLIDARQDREIAHRYRSLGYELTDGMVASVGGQVWHGSDAVWVLTLLSSRSGPWNGVLALVFRNRRVVRMAYPLMRLGRTLTLSVMGRERRI